MRSSLSFCVSSVLATFALVASGQPTSGAGDSPANAPEASIRAPLVVKAAKSDLDAVGQNWLSKEKFTVLWTFPGSRDQSWTASPASKKFNFHSSDYCERGIFAAEYSVDNGQLVIAVPRKPDCGSVEMRFDLNTLKGTAGLASGGRMDVLPGRVLYLKE
jgi:hypothetical protein